MPSSRSCARAASSIASPSRPSTSRISSAWLLASQRERIDAAASAVFSQVVLRAMTMTPEVVAHARDVRGLEIRAWGVRSTADMEHAIAVGANGMTIDWPDRLLARLRELGVDADGASASAATVQGAR